MERRYLLIAAPNETAAFLGWSGACSGTSSSCVVTMGAPASVAASFTSINGGSQAGRTWVSGAYGNDEFLPRAAPCLTFASCTRSNRSRW